MRLLTNKATLSILVAVAAVLLFQVTPAFADGTVYPLTHWNVAELNTTSPGTVIVTVGDSHIHVQWSDSGASSLTALGIDKFYYNGTLVDVMSSGWTKGNGDPATYNGPQTNADGFGSFNSGKNSAPGSGDLAFTLLLYGAFEPSDNTPHPGAGNEPGFFAAHIRFSNGCSGWISDGVTTSIGSDPNCGTSVPEPSTLPLLSLGLLGLGFGLVSGKLKLAVNRN